MPDEVVEQKEVVESAEDKKAETATEKLSDDELKGALENALDKPDNEEKPDKELTIGLDDKGEVVDVPEGEKLPGSDKPGEQKIEGEAPIIALQQ